MKIIEIVRESVGRKPLRKSAEEALPNLSQYDALDNNNNPYLAYRFGIALAASPDSDMYQKGPIGSNFNTIDYSAGDKEIRLGAERIMGIQPSRSTGEGSVELSQTNNKSPVRARTKNKFGV
jgi:hypothetical protein